MAADKKYYWLKLRRDFYKRHDFKRIRKRGGNDAALLYLLLMMESVDHDARLRYSEQSAYTVADLADAFDMDEDTIERSLKVLTDAEVLVTEEDGTMFLPKCLPLIGSETEAARLKRQQRATEEVDNV